MKPAKFEVQALLPIGLTLVVLGIGLAYGLEVMGDTATDIATDSCADKATYTAFNESSGLCYNPSNVSQTAAVGDSEYNATLDGITGVSKLPEKLPTIVTVIVAAVIIGILVRYMIMR